MTIAHASVFIVTLPLISPFRTGFGELTERELVFVKLTDSDGVVGYGESANLAVPIYEPEWNGSMVLLLTRHILPALIGADIPSVDALTSRLSVIRGNNFAKAAVEAAYWHLVSQRNTKPLRELWGGTKQVIPAAISIGLGTTEEESVAKAKDAIDRYSPVRAKLKIRPGIDVGYIERIRNTYPNLPIMVDANASYTPNNVGVMRALDRLGLVMIEQPYAYNDLADHASLARSIQTPVCLDESITSYHTAEEAIALGACSIFNIKPQRVGGYGEAARISRLAGAHGASAWCGGMIESGWGQIFNCNIATLPDFTFENDICLTKWYLADDIIAGAIPERHGVIDVAETDRLLSFDQEKLTRYRTWQTDVG